MFICCLFSFLCNLCLKQKNKKKIKNCLKMENFSNKFSLAERKEKFCKVSRRFPGRIPVVMQRNTRSDLPPLKKHFYLFGPDVACSRVMLFIRRQIKISSTTGLFFFVDDVIPSMSSTLSELYDKKKSEDGFLYLVYSGENTFGTN